MIIQELRQTDLNDTFLQNFEHFQTYHRIWKKTDDQWVLEETNSIIRKWDNEKRLWIPKYLGQKLDNGGYTFAAYLENKLVGFISLDGDHLGSSKQYMNLSMLFIDDRYQRRGIGKLLFDKCAKRALNVGAEKLFISAIPSEDTVAFYLAMGCKDAEEIIPDFVDTPYDRYLEFLLR